MIGKIRTITTIFVILLSLSLNAQVKEYFGATPDLHVDGKEFKDPQGNAVTLHGVMDTPNAYFNGWRWTNGNTWADYNSDQSVANVKKYFTKIFQAIANPAKGTYCNLFRLHLDPAWLKDNSIIATGFTNINDDAKTATDPSGHNVFDEANICHFSYDKLRTRMQDLYIPIIEDAIAHGLYVVVRPPGVFPEDVAVGDYYNTYLLNVWDIVSSNTSIKAHSGQIMLELGNEPVRMTGNLADYFQPIVNKIRSNGFTGIILLPGTSYQADYRSYNTKAITDSNYGYAVHNYPGWYGGWDANQSEANFISTFEAQVPVDKKPIVITEVDWSPMSEGNGHWNETHTQYTEANFGTWGTGTTNGTTAGAKMQTTQNIGWGLRFRHLVDKHPNISFTLQGTTTYVDMDTYIANGQVQPAFYNQMTKEGYPDAKQACSGYCFDWYYEFACGNRIPYGTPNVLPEVMTYKTTATTIGDAYFDEANAHYCFYKPSYSSFVFKEYAGTPLEKCAEFTINLGEGSEIGYRLDVQLKDKDGNIIKDGTNDYIIGTEAKGTRFTTAENKTYDFQTIFADYINKYPDCTVGDIRLNTVVSSEDTGKTGKYWFTIDKMDMNVSEVTAREGSKGTNLADVKMYRHTSQTNYVYDTPTNLGGWYNNGVQADITNNNDGSYRIVVTKIGNSWEGQFNIGNNTYTNETEYTLQLDIKGGVAGNIGAAIQKSEGYVGRGNFPSIPVTKSWQTVTVKATVEGEGADRILLNFGDYLGTLDIKNIKVSYTNDNTTEITGNNISLGNNLTEAEVFGAGLLGNVAWNEYVDLSSYSKMIVKGTGGSLRVLYNRPETGNCPELNPTLASGEAIVDLSVSPYFHLNSIKAGYGQTVNVSSITLVSGDGNNVDIADYYITGAGHITGDALAALNDVKATVIDATGLTNTKPWSLSTANPNCIIIYNDDNQIGFTWSETTRNLVKESGGYSAYRTNLYDDYEFRAPFAFNTVGGATYTRTLTNGNWGTMALPFDLKISELGDKSVYKLTGDNGGSLSFTKVTSNEQVMAGTVILYNNPLSGETILKGKDIAKTSEGFNIQPVGENGWFTAQSFTSQVIDDVKTHPVLKDYEVYAISGNKFVHATKKLTLKPFRALYLLSKTRAASISPLSSYSIRIEDEANGISDTYNASEAPETMRFDMMGRRISSPVKGVNIIRTANGVVKKVINK